MISIIVPVFNIELYLPRCINSIISQSYSDLQIILVNDGSTDNSGAICESFALSDTRIKVVHKENGGLVTARKTGLKYADGEFVGFVDGDDYVDPEMFDRLSEVLQRESVDFVHSGWVKNDSLDVYGISDTGTFELDILDRSDLICDCVLDTTSSRAVSPSIWSKLYKKDFIMGAYQEVPDGLDFGEDLVCLCLCMLKAGKYAVVPEAYYHYVTRESSITNANGLCRLEREHKLYDCLKDILKKYSVYYPVSGTLDRFYVRSLLVDIKKSLPIMCPVYQYPDVKDLYGKKILLYGAGEVGRDYFVQFRCDMHCMLVAVVDKNFERYHLKYVDVIGIDEIVSYKYDIIIIGVLYERMAEGIRKDLTAAGVSDSKIVWKKPEFAV
ncbi:putative glycosyltransferase EpsJ [Lachnospiraceae bacterium]|nr:putative glycosyltransferase EpsJ [Lachnospiraceae bacterium]